MCIERQVIEYCSPTLARLKTGSLFNCRYDSENEIAAAVCELNMRLNKKDVYFTILRKEKGRALIYVYRKSRLDEALKESEACKLLKSCGYCFTESSEAIEMLSKQLTNKADFPHEIGVFLGYPICDVIEIIRNKGQNAKLTGCWKVYGNVADARLRFSRFKKCTDTYIRPWEMGRGIEKLTVGI